MMVLPRRLKKKMRKTLVFFVKFAKRLITMQKNVGTRNGSKQFFCEKHEEEREENLFFASKSDASRKRMNGMLIVVVVIT